MTGGTATDPITDYVRARHDKYPSTAGLAQRDDPTHGRIDRDIQWAVYDMGCTSIGQIVAIEGTLQAKRDRGEDVLAALTGKRLPHVSVYDPADGRRHVLAMRHGMYIVIGVAALVVVCVIAALAQWWPAL